MQGKLLLRLFSMFVAVAFSAFAQIDAARFAAGLRANYGPPLTRNVVFTVPVGEIVVDYATSGHVCKIRLPAMAPDEGRAGVSTKAVDDFLLKLLPLSMRGEELQKMQGQQGLASVLTTEYEHVTISEVSQGQGRTGVTVIFTNEKC